MAIIGIFASIIAAVFQALNYAISKKCQETYHLYGLKVLIASHIGMGFILLWPFIFLRYYSYFEWNHLIDLLKINIPFLMAQYFIFLSLRVSDASIVSPLLVLKLPVLTGISVVLFHDTFTAFQYSAIAFILVISWIFSSLSGQIKFKALLFVFITCCGYVTSDIAITEYTKKFATNVFEQSLIANSYNYIAGALFFIPCAFIKGVTIKDIYHCRYISLIWIISVLFIVIGFKLSGVVSGNIIQTLRGPFGIIITLLFFKDQILDHGEHWKRKIFLSILMTLAVVVFYI